MRLAKSSLSRQLQRYALQALHQAMASDNLCESTVIFWLLALRTGVQFYLCLDKFYLLKCHDIVLFICSSFVHFIFMESFVTYEIFSGANFSFTVAPFSLPFSNVNECRFGGKLLRIDGRLVYIGWNPLKMSQYILSVKYSTLLYLFPRGLVDLTRTD